jgi:hypothetical protein
MSESISKRHRRNRYKVDLLGTLINTLMSLDPSDETMEERHGLTFDECMVIHQALADQLDRMALRLDVGPAS